MYYDPTNAFVSSACLGHPVLMVHRLSGSYLAEGGDLQLKHEPQLTGKSKDDAKALWRLHAVLATADGTVLYRIENLGNQKYLALPKGTDNPEDVGLTYVDKLDPKDGQDDKEFYNQLWIFQPVEGNSVLISSSRFTEQSLAPYDRNPATVNGCDRNPKHITVQGNDNNCWLHHHRVVQYPDPQKDPFCHANCKNC
ncbi:hypothetical protein [Streptomyces sp. 3N207]|uniref:hypothetical protein n=1 Tax=Streptomyces sp. 3N207 TaxID=3457417 RepID=UPI003FD4C7D2